MMELPFDPYILLYHLDRLVLSSPYFKLIVVFGLSFLFIVLLASVRKHLFHLSLKGATFGFVVGMLVMLFLDLIVLLGISDKEVMRDLFSKENRKEAVADVVASGISNLNNVLGVSVAVSSERIYTKQEILEGLVALPNEDVAKIRDLLCPN